MLDHNKATEKQPHSLTFLTDENPKGRKILLLDLVWTTAYRPNNVRGDGSYFDTITNHELYRTELLDKLREEGWYIVLFTARHKKYQEITLKSIYDKTGGFIPDACAFDMESGQPPVTKRHNLLNGILPILGDDRSKYLSIESNNSTSYA